MQQSLHCHCDVFFAKAWESSYNAALTCPSGSLKKFCWHCAVGSFLWQCAPIRFMIPTIGDYLSMQVTSGSKTFARIKKWKRHQESAGDCLHTKVVMQHQKRSIKIQCECCFCAPNKLSKVCSLDKVAEVCKMHRNKFSTCQSHRAAWLQQTRKPGTLRAKWQCRWRHGMSSRHGEGRIWGEESPRLWQRVPWPFHEAVWQGGNWVFFASRQMKLPASGHRLHVILWVQRIKGAIPSYILQISSVFCLQHQ